MLDSYKNTVVHEGFNSELHFIELCKVNKVITSEHCKINYQKGWRELVSSVLNLLKNYPLKITMIDDTHGQLDIKFEMLQRSGELSIWRKLDDLKYQSRNICMLCGERSARITAIRPNCKLCTDCFKQAGSNRNTGTWLDKY